LIAEEVAEVNPDLVVRDEKGEIYTVRYDAVSAMLLNEFLKEHRKVEEQQTTIEQLKSNAAKQEANVAQLKDEGTSHEATIRNLEKAMETLIARLNEQDSKIQNVSGQLATGRVRPTGGLEVSRPAPQTALNNQ
jgi:septal ring factor EnvC (AmiA/AmiB activator)